jgi:hypothetical protein
VYWCNYAGGEVRRAKIPPPGPSPTWPLAETLNMTSLGNEPAAVAVDSTTVYWGTYFKPAVLSTPIRGEMNPSSLETGMSMCCIFSIAVDATSVYWTNTNGEVWKTTKVYIPGAVPLLLATSPNGVATSVAVDDKYVYWINKGTSTLSYTDGSVTAVAK